MRLRSVCVKEDVREIIVDIMMYTLGETARAFKIGIEEFIYNRATLLFLIILGVIWGWYFELLEFAFLNDSS